MDFLTDPTIIKYKMADIIKDSWTGKIRCTCYRSYDCPSKGKHYLDNFPEPIKVIDKAIPHLNYQAEFPDDMIVLDVDNVESFKFFLNDFGLRRFETPTVKSNKGFHYYFKTPKALCQQTIYYGIELKNKINIPPSKRQDGSSYEWIISPDEIDYEELPSEIFSVAKLKTSRKNFTLFDAPSPCDDWELDIIQKSFEGHCYNPDCEYESWFHIACLLHSTGSLYAFEIWLNWSSRGQKFKGQKTEDLMKKIWNGIKYSPFTHYSTLTKYGVTFCNSKLQFK